ncbi:MAG: hypothetical protein CVT89_06200 [Candidatus Altiarchaeales archaeon HGW-Altiarchaeales-2]|nr:MAG: hypothetical protein CVT89_06200 [Candidatus Altiarchaeales archaeon HGW-Altiarchaeales-2]
MTGEFGKGIIPMNNGTPFYTINNNPQICSNMLENQTCNKTWQVNATGAVGKTWEFFTIFNSSLAGSSQTGKVNITIIGQYAHCGCDNGTYNYTCGEIVMKSCVMNCNLIYNSTCFTVGANNITINGNGYSITGDGNWGGDNGIYANGRTNVIIKNFNIYNFGHGIYVYSSNNNNIDNNTANSNGRGIRLDYSSNNIIINNTANNNTYYGFYLDSSNNNTITNNTANSNDYGIYLSHSSNNKLNSNFVCGNTNLDFNSNNWLSSNGDNNTCDKSDNWKDSSMPAGTIGCKGKCQINKAKDIFDVVEMLEYLSGQKNSTQLSNYNNYNKYGYYKFVGNNSDDINLSDAFALINKIVIDN